MEPSDYYPDAYYRSPPEEPQRKPVERRHSAGTAERPRATRVYHRGLAGHYHLQRAAHPESDEVAEWEI